MELAGGPDYDFKQEESVYRIQQQPVQRVEKKYKTEVKKHNRTFEDKARDTINFIGDTWGYSFLLLGLVAAFIKKDIWYPKVKGAVKKTINKW